MLVDSLVTIHEVLIDFDEMTMELSLLESMSKTSNHRNLTIKRRN